MNFIFLVFVFIGLNSNAYPDLFRHGYNSCIACHETPSGGDLLTPYGKSLAKEILTAKSNDILNKELVGQNIEPGAGEESEEPWWRMGLNSRLLQSFTESSKASKARFMIMQLDVDSSVRLNSYTKLYFSMGRAEPTVADAGFKDFVYVPRAWMQLSNELSDNDVKYFLRAGRFLPAYGIAFSEHVLATRKYLNLVPSQEKLAIEFSVIFQNFEIQIDRILSSYSYGHSQNENGYSGRLNYSLNENKKIGFSFYRSKMESSDQTSRKSFEGVFTQLAFNEFTYALVELDHERKENGDSAWIQTGKIGYELNKGLQFFVTEEYQNPDIQKTDPHFQAIGVGVHYFPVTHIDFESEFKKELYSSVSSEYQNVLWIVAHIYY